MRQHIVALTFAGILGVSASATFMRAQSVPSSNALGGPAAVQLGPRPFFLVDDMTDGPLKNELESAPRPVQTSDFSIGHRGAALQFPEHTRESYDAAARMGAGILECDVTFTKDRELVCRHAQCDLHTTTNILARRWPRSARSRSRRPCSTRTATLTRRRRRVPHQRHHARRVQDAARQDGRVDPRAHTVAEYLGGTPTSAPTSTRPTSGTLLTHKESIELFKKLGVKMTPELKAPSVPMPFEGFTQEFTPRR